MVGDIHIKGISIVCALLLSTFIHAQSSSDPAPPRADYDFSKEKARKIKTTSLDAEGNEIESEHSVTIGKNANDEKMEKNLFLTTLQERKVEGLIQDSKQFQQCYKDHFQGAKIKTIQGKMTQANKVRNCFRKKLTTGGDGALSEKDIIELGDKLGLSKYNLVQSKTATAITNYLSDRVEAKIFGKDYNKHKFSQMKFIDQGEYFRMYRSLMGKAVMLKIAQYCIENTKINCKTVDANNLKQDCTVSKNQIDESIENNKFTDKIEQLSQKAIKQDYLFNCLQIIRDTCEFNKTGKAISENDFKSKSQQLINEAVTDQSNYDDKKGKACLLTAQLRNYRRTLVSLKQVEDKFKEHTKNFGGNGVQGNANYVAEVDVEKVTTITSADMAKIDELKSLSDQCGKSSSAANPANTNGGTGTTTNKKCKEHLDKVSRENIEGMKLEYELKTALNLKEIERIKDKEALKAYLTKHGYPELLKNYEQADMNDIKNVLQQKFLAERQALIQNLKSKFESQSVAFSKDKDTNYSANEANALKNIKKDIETRRKKIVHLFHFTNLMSTTLDLEDGDSKKKKFNRIGFDNEMQAASEFQDEEDKDLKGTIFQEARIKQLTKNLKNSIGNREVASGGNGQSFNINAGIIDQIITGDDAKKKPPTNSPPANP